jgi:hypothetical protein
MITGLMAAEDVPVKRVHAATWKRALGLTKTGKAGSLALARQLVPGATDLLKCALLVFKMFKLL